MRWLAVITLAVVLGCAQGLQPGDPYIQDEERFPGWKGELPSTTVEVDDTVGFGELGKELWRGKVEQVSWKPRAFLYHNFLSDEECEHLKALGAPHLAKSTVVDNESGQSVDSDVRTSSGMFLNKHHDEVVARIEKRISHITMIPEENGEGIQILKYIDGQKYEPHTDYFHDAFNKRKESGGQRVATVLMYLATPEEGGETVFPHVDDSVKVTGDNWSECARKGLAVKAVKGNALLFYSLRPNGDEDVASTHGSCPTTKGEKWSATKWIHVGAFSMGAEVQTAKWKAGECADHHESCKEWALFGECDKNAAYMSSTCRKACKLCDPSSPDAAEQQA